MTEKDIEKKVCAYAKQLGMGVYKFVSPGKSGVPDRMFVDRGRVLFIEFKRPGAKPTKLQLHEHGELLRHKLPVAVIDSVTAGTRRVCEFYLTGG